MNKKSVGIITLPGNFNFGNRLQCYAMVRSIECLGCTPTVLEREKLFPLYRRAWYGMRSAALSILGGDSADNPEMMRSSGRVSAFKRFSERIPSETLPGMGSSAANKYDCFVVGSDQVWNPIGIRHQEPWYFATFAQPERCFAVAASLGVDRFSNVQQSDRLAEGIRGFSRVSVREKRGAELIKECSGTDVEVVCDPTLVLPADEWRGVADGRCTPMEPYVITYLLGGVGPEASVVLEEVTNHGCITVVPLSDRQKPGEPDAGPAEFIDLIDNAVHVVTDSFHAAVFSSILETPLTIVHREGGASMFSRLEQLAQMLDIEEKVYGSDSFDLSLAGDYKGVPEAIGRERERFMGFLKGCLDG